MMAIFLFGETVTLTNINASTESIWCSAACKCVVYPKIKIFWHHIFTFMSFQTCMTVFLSAEQRADFFFGGGGGIFIHTINQQGLKQHQTQLTYCMDKKIVRISSFVFHRRKHHTGLEWDEGKKMMPKYFYLWVNYSFNTFASWWIASYWFSSQIYCLIC